MGDLLPLHRVLQVRSLNVGMPHIQDKICRAGVHAEILGVGRGVEVRMVLCFLC